MYRYGSLQRKVQGVLANNWHVIATSLHPQFRIIYNDDGSRKSRNFFVYKEMQQAFKAKATNLLQEKLEGQDAYDEMGIWTKVNIWTNFLIFIQNKQQHYLRQSKDFADEEPQMQISSSIVLLSKWCAEKSLNFM